MAHFLPEKSNQSILLKIEQENLTFHFKSDHIHNGKITYCSTTYEEPHYSDALYSSRLKPVLQKFSLSKI